MMDYSEKRDFIRMPVQCPISVREAADQRPDQAELLDLSATGLRFISHKALNEGARLQVRVSPDNPITPPLEARISVLRCLALDDGFDIAAAIETIEPATYPIDE